MSESLMPCPACLAADTRRTADQWNAAQRTYGLSICRSCGTAHTAPLPGDDALTDFYRNAYDYRWFRDHFGAKLRDSRMRVAEYGPVLGRKVLDFGGGLGYFSQAVRESGRESVTFDPYFGSDIPEQGAWDTVVALHVLEHSNDLVRTLGQIKGLLADRGRLLLAVPNYAGLGYRVRGMAWTWAQPPLAHIFHFTAAGLRALLERHGFGEIAVSYHERWDANRYCDVEHADRFARWDAAWGKRPYRAFPLYRRAIAFLNARRRYAGLTRALSGHDPGRDDCAELQVTAVLRK